MKFGRLAIAAFVALSAQCTSEIFSSHVMAGGVVRAALDGNAEVAAAGLCTITADPITLNAASGDLSLGLIGGSDGTGQLAFAILSGPNTSITLPIGDVSRTQLQVYVGGSGCVASAGSVALSIDADGNVLGTIDASGSRTSGAACTITGEMTGVPVQR